MISPTILKFGGTSVADVNAIRRVCDIVAARRDQQPVVIVSALGGFTDALLRSLELARTSQFDEALTLIEAELARHKRIAEALLTISQQKKYDLILPDARDSLTL